MSVIGWEYYDGFTPEGTSRDEKWLRIGWPKLRLEIGPGGFFLRLGPVEFTGGGADG